MSDYKDVIATGAGSFRGVPFLITENIGQKGGRRTAKREFPRRENGGADDLGRRLRERSFNCVVLGNDYLEQKDALIDALDAAGPGELVHPLLGTMQVMIDSWESSEALDKQGVCSFSINVLPPLDSTAPVATSDTAAASAKAADKSVTALNDSFVDTWDVSDLSMHDVQAMVAGATQSVNALSETVSSMLSWVDGVQDVLADCAELKGNVQALIDQPADFARDLTNIIGSIKSLGEFSDSAVAYKSLLSRLQVEPATSSANAVPVNSDDADSVTFVDPVSQQARTNLLALDVLTYQTALVNACECVTGCVTDAAAAAESRGRSSVISGLSPIQASNDGQEYNPLESQTVVADTAQTLGNELDAQVMAASELGWGMTAQALRAYRLIFLADMKLRAERLPTSVAVTPLVTEPALVTLYRQTGNARNWQTFARRNDLPNPLFVAGGEVVEVLSE